MKYVTINRGRSMDTQNDIVQYVNVTDSSKINY